VFRIRGNLVQIWICGTVPLLLDPDPAPDLDLAPDPALFVSGLQDTKKLIFLPSFFAYYFLKIHLHHSSKIKLHKEVTKQWN
jgi:hypothetical protein